MVAPKAIPRDWEETTSPSEIKKIKEGTLEGGTREHKWYRAEPNPKLEMPSSELVPAPPFLVDLIIEGLATGYWRRKGPGPPNGKWFVKKNTYLVYSHSALGKTKIAPVPGKGDWLAALLPWLWHLIHWTPRGLWLWGIVWTVGHFTLEYVRVSRFTNRYGDPDDGSGVIRFFEFALYLAVFITYFNKASFWRVEHLERRGFKLQSAVEARSKDEALAKASG